MAPVFPKAGYIVIGTCFGFCLILFIIYRTYKYFANKAHRLPEFSHVEDERQAERQREAKRLADLERSCVGKPVTKWKFDENEGGVEVKHKPIEARLSHGNASIQLAQPRGSHF
jgi:hypothetical protein